MTKQQTHYGEGIQMRTKQLTTSEVELTVDKEFHGLIPALHREQREDLAHSVNKYGRFLDPIRYWNDGKKNLILDGHQRYHLWLGLPEDTPIPPPLVEEMSFPDREAAMEWMESYQISRRNLDARSLSMIRGRMYNRRKGAPGRPKNDEKNGAPGNTASGMPQNGKTADRQQFSDGAQSAAEVAKKTGVGTSTVREDGAFVDALDAIGKVNGKAAADIESQDLKLRKKDVIAIGKLNREDIGKAIRNLRAGRKWDDDGKPKKYNDTFDVGEIEKQPRPAKATIDLPEGYVDDLNKEVPESLFPVWRERERFMRLAGKCKEIVTELSELKKTAAGKHLSPDIRKSIDEAGRQIALAMPSVVDGKSWKTVGEAGK